MNRGEDQALRLSELEGMIKLCKKYGVEKIRYSVTEGVIDLQFPPLGSAPAYLDENLPPERQMQELEKHVVEQKKRIEQTALVDSLGAS